MKINIQRLKSILENPEEPIGPDFVLTVIDNLIGLNNDEIDFIWLKLERKYNIEVARKDSVSAAVAFYHNPSEFFMNPNAFDKMAIAFNSHNIIPTAINQPTPEEATYAIMVARKVIVDILKNKYGNKYPLLPDVARYVAAIYHHAGLIVFHQSIKEYQPILTSFDINEDAKKDRQKILEMYKVYEDNRADVVHSILNNADGKSFIHSNISRLIAIDLYSTNMMNYSEVLCKKIFE